jgi:hypothetical protein
MRQKNMDYSGGDGDPFANFRIAEAYGVHPVMGIILRSTDKLQRVRAFIKNGVCAVDGESVDDACDDLVNYAILMKGLLREERIAAAAKKTYAGGPSGFVDIVDPNPPVFKLEDFATSWGAGSL